MDEITSRIDSVELSQIKNQFSLRERINSENFEANQFGRRNPAILFNSPKTSLNLSNSVLRGLAYPLRLDGKGGLEVSANYDRIGEQIIEVLETRIGERAYRPFFGLPETIFETINEYALAQTIRSQIEASLPIIPQLGVRVILEEDGKALILISYSVEGLEAQMIRYSFSI